MQGFAKKLTFALSTSGDMLQAKLIDSQVNEELKALSEGQIAYASIVRQGSDLIVSKGMTSAIEATRGKPGLTAFAVNQIDSSRYKTGSHVDVDSYSLLTGLGYNFPLNEGSYGDLMLASFFEGGWGNYNSYNSFSTGTVKGSGDTSYQGGGVMMRYDAPFNVYADASFRAGYSKTDFSSSDMYTPSGRDVEYDSGSVYHGFHAGLGYIWDVTDALSLDFSTKYIAMRQESDSVVIEDEKIRFAETESSRWRSGAKIAYALESESGYIFSPYLGASYDREFKGKAKATVNGDAIDAPDLSGSTGIGEVGIAFKPTDLQGLSLDLGVQSYVGKREGVGGSLQMQYAF